MKNHHDLLGLAANIFIVVFVFCFIVVGLNLIGIYDLPEPIEKLLGTYRDEVEDSESNTHALNESVSFSDKSEIDIQTSNLTYENARKLLLNVSPVESYNHEISVDYYNSLGVKASSENIDLTRKNGVYSAVVTNEAEDVVLKILNDGEHVRLSKLHNGEMRDMLLEKGNFDISDECGFVLTVENFLNSEFPLDEASFSVGNGPFGGELNITFDSIIGEYLQTETYTVSLDFGVVISAECFEDEKLVYSMKTNSLYYIN